MHTYSYDNIIFLTNCYTDRCTKVTQRHMYTAYYLIILHQVGVFSDGWDLSVAAH